MFNTSGCVWVITDNSNSCSRGLLSSRLYSLFVTPCLASLYHALSRLCRTIKVRFRMLVFRPFVGEILSGTVSACNKQGIKVRHDLFFAQRQTAALLCFWDFPSSTGAGTAGTDALPIYRFACLHYCTTSQVFVLMTTCFFLFQLVHS